MTRNWFLALRALLEVVNELILAGLSSWEETFDDEDDESDEDREYNSTAAVEDRLEDFRIRMALWKLELGDSDERGKL